MLKIVGIFIVLIGTVGAINSWREKQRMQIKHIKQMCRFFQRARYAFEAEKLPCIDFFSSYQTDDEVLQETMNTLVALLRSHKYPTGETAWKDAFLEHIDSWGLEKEGYDIVIASGKAFFGKNLAENIEQMETYEKQLSEYLALEERTFREKNKVFTPVGFLGGIMLVILLI